MPNLQWANDVIARQVEQLVRVVDDLLDISRITGGKIQLRMEPWTCRWPSPARSRPAGPLIDGRRHELIVTLPPEPVYVTGDLVRLAQVLANLLNNAAKYTEEGGRIALEVAQAGDEVVFRVRDNGVGIAPEMVSSIFDLFIQVDRSLDRSQGGLGVGLTLVRQLVEMHGGSVQAHSEGANRGSEFVIRLPLLPGATAPPNDADSRPDRTGSPASRRILIVEDCPAGREPEAVVTPRRPSGAGLSRWPECPGGADAPRPRSSSWTSACRAWMATRSPGRSASGRAPNRSS